VRPALAIVLLLSLGPLSCLSSSQDKEIRHADEVLADLDEKEKQAALSAGLLFDKENIASSSVEQVFDMILPVCTGYHDGLNRLDGALLAKSDMGRRAYANYLLRYETALREFNLFLTSVALRWPDMVRNQQTWFHLLVAHLAEAVSFFRADHTAMGVHFRAAGSQAMRDIPPTPFLKDLVGGVRLLPSEERKS